jgi:hypothetical protein
MKLRSPILVKTDALAALDEGARKHPATIEDVFEGASPPIAMLFDTGDDLSACIKKLRAEIAELKGAHRNDVAQLRLALTEARCEVREMRAIQESARATSRGEAGIAGPRGIPGPPGVGQIGPAGPPGRDAAAIAAWEPRVEQFQVVLVYADGTRGPPISLRPFFEMYDAATEDDYDDG